jgi:hypothetical protein
MDSMPPYASGGISYQGGATTATRRLEPGFLFLRFCSPARPAVFTRFRTRRRAAIGLHYVDSLVGADIGVALAIRSTAHVGERVLEARVPVVLLVCRHSLTLTLGRSSGTVVSTWWLTASGS